MQVLWRFLFMFSVSGVLAVAQTPDLSGTWKLSHMKSSFGGEHVSSDYELTKQIVSKGSSFLVTDIQIHPSWVNIPLPDSKTETELIPDGKEYPSRVSGRLPGAPPTLIVMSTEWQGNTLFIRQSGLPSGTFLNADFRYYLSGDGSQLIELTELHRLFGDFEQRLVFDRVR